MTRREQARRSNQLASTRDLLVRSITIEETVDRLFRFIEMIAISTLIGVVIGVA